MNSIYIIGYYGHSNLGDEQYKITLEYIFRSDSNRITWVDCDQIDSYAFQDEDRIILGGGDVLNSYFLDPVYRVFKDRPNRLFAFSVGIPYLEILTHPGLQRLDAIFLRTRQDLTLLAEYYNPQRVHCIPDASCLLSEIYRPIRMPRLRQICIALARTVYHHQYPKEYQHFIESLGLLINQLIAKDYLIYLIPFNTCTSSPRENDILIQNDVCHKIIKSSQVFNIRHSVAVKDTMTLFQCSHACIAMRFHAVLLAAYTHTPVVPIYTTRKIKNWIQDVKWPIDIPLRVNSIDIPRGLTLEQLDHIHSYVDSPPVVEHTFSPNLYHGLVHLQDYMTQSTWSRSIPRNISTELFSKLQDTFHFQHLTDVSDPDLQQQIVSFVSFRFTRTLYSKYNPGLLTKMFTSDYDYSSEWEWIRKNQTLQGNVLPNQVGGLFNMDYIHQVDSHSLHRSGWNYVYEYLKSFHNKQAPILLDLYVDRTFHWDYKMFKQVGVVPYTQAWIGFVHHPFDTTFSRYNSTELFKNPDFIQSLNYCKGLFVLSTYLKEQFIEACVQYHVYPKIYVLTHPTETSVQPFSYSDWLKQPEKRLIHVGGWLRRTFNFYALELPSRLVAISNRMCCGSSVEYSLIKTVLRGKQMNNYFPLSGFSDQFTQFLSKFESSCSQQMISSGGVHNNWNMQCLDYIQHTLNSVVELNHVSNESYDDLLSKHIVMIDLVDASAVNTLIECVVRNTPILINTHPAVIEILGKDYPLYFKHGSTPVELSIQIQKLLSNEKIIYKAHRYLSKLDKSRFTIQQFIKEFTEIIQKL